MILEKLNNWMIEEITGDESIDSKGVEVEPWSC